MLVVKGSRLKGLPFAQVNTADKPINNDWISSSAFSVMGRKSTRPSFPQPSVTAVGHSQGWSPLLL